LPPDVLLSPAIAFVLVLFDVMERQFEPAAVLGHVSESGTPIAANVVCPVDINVTIANAAVLNRVCAVVMLSLSAGTLWSPTSPDES
jgi:hypothetical protein